MVSRAGPICSSIAAIERSFEAVRNGVLSVGQHGALGDKACPPQAGVHGLKAPTGRALIRETHSADPRSKMPLIPNGVICMKKI
jgi:hypothetical protein